MHARPRTRCAGWAGGRRRRCRPSANAAGSRLAEPSSAATLPPGGHRHVAEHDVLLRGPLEQLQRRVVADHLLDRGRRPGRGPRAAGPAGRDARAGPPVPLPNALTDASCPALSSRMAEATSSSSVSRSPSSSAAHQVADQVLARRPPAFARRGRACTPTNSAAAATARAPRRPRCGRTRTSSRCRADHGRSSGRSASGTPSSSAMTATGSGSA